MNRKPAGFTLIELMIVVAIIGLLAAIAIPSYRSYIARSQASEAIVLLGGLMRSVEEDLQQNGNFPADVPALQALSTPLSGEYVSSIAPANVVGSSGELHASFKATQTSPLISGKSVVFIRSATGNWSCSPSKSTTPQNLLPPLCK